MLHSLLRQIAFAASISMAAVTISLAQTDHGAMHTGGSDASKAYMDAMTKMDDAMRTMKMTGKPGVDFAAMMIPHHQSAIDMAKAYLASGENDPELTKLAKDIIAAQESEIEFLEKWLAENGG